MKKRENNVEVCRVCIMFFIVMHHCIVSELGLNEQLNSGLPCFSVLNCILIVLNSFFVVSVNVFFLISGYFGIKFGWKKLYKVISEVVVCSTCIYVIALAVGIEKFSIKGLISYTILSINEYWFVIVYIALMLVSPILNNSINFILEKKNEKKVLFVAFFCLCVYGYLFSSSVSAYIGINNGYSFIFAIFLYFTGRVIHEHKDKITSIFNAHRSLASYFATCQVISGGGGILTWLNHGNLTWKLFNYNNPLVYLASVFFFILFLNISAKSNLLTFIGGFGKNVFMVYILHTSSLVRPYRFYLVKYAIGFIDNPVVDILIIVIYCFALFVVCLFISRNIDKVLSVVSSWLGSKSLEMKKR